MTYTITEDQRLQLQSVLNGCYGTTAAMDVFEAVQMLQSLEPVKGKPVAWGMPDANGNIVDTITELDRVGDMTKWAEQYSTPLYTHPQRELSDEEIKSMWQQYCGYPGGIFDFARAVLEKARTK